MTAPRAPRNRTLDTISDRARRAAETAVKAFAWLDDQRALIPPLTAQTTDDTGHGKGSHADPTGTTVLELDVFTRRRQAIRDGIDTLNLAMRLTEEAILDAYKGAPAELETFSTSERQLCRGGEPDTWGDPECNELVDHYTRDDGSIGYRSDGLCAKHGRRKRRWETQQRQSAMEGASS